MAEEQKRRLTPETESDDYGFSQRRPQQQGHDLQRSILRTFDETETLIDKLNQETSFSKKPKDDKTVIEELEVANCHLRRMVDSLFVELGHCERQNSELRAKIDTLEKELAESRARERQLEDLQQSQRFQQHSNDDEVPLTPLEMPTFDYGD